MVFSFYSRIDGSLYLYVQQVDPWKTVYKVEFANMKAFKHYRKAIALDEILSLGYKPRLYHEQDSQIQMFTGMVDYTYFDWVEIPYSKFRVAEASEWNEYETLRKKCPIHWLTLLAPGF